MTPGRRPSMIDSLETRRLFAAILGDVGAQPTGPLTGKIIYASAGHGLNASSTGVWSTDRGVTNSLVEDFGNQDQLTYFADAAWRAGATVVPMRPVGHQTNEAIVDNVDATYSGAWSNTTNTSVAYYSTSNGNGVRYRFASTSLTETAVATFRPTLSAGGFYPVYAWATDGTDRAADQIYRVNHAGGATEVKVDHSKVGKGWVYLGTYSFNAGTAGNVQISNKSATTGKVVIADAIRFGNGMGDIARAGRTSGQAREDEASLYWVEASRGWTAPGVRVATSNYRTSSDDGTANVGAPLRWAAYMNRSAFGESVYLSFHSNAGGGRGSDGLYNNASLFPGTATTNQRAWALLVGKEVTDDLVRVGTPTLEYAWQNSTSPIFARSDYAFGEIRADVNGNEFDATILEVAFHDDAQDAALMRDPFVRQKVAESSTQATVRYFNTYGTGTALTFAPDAPDNLRTSVDATLGDVTLRWDAPATANAYGGPPTGYRVYASRDGYSFDGGQYVAGASNTSLQIAASAIGSGVAYFKVVSVNAGGESVATQVAAVRRGQASVGRVLIVNGFDRLDRSQNTFQSIAIGGTFAGSTASTSSFARVRPREGNSFDYAVPHASALAAVGPDLGFDTIDNEAILTGKVNLNQYRAILWIAGEESTEDQTFAPAEQTAIANYVTAGGRLMVSGSEVGWDLVARNNGASFFANTLKSGYVSDDANTNAASGVSGSIFSGLSLQFGFDSTSYNVDFPDVLRAPAGSSAVMNYATGGVAATAWAASNGARVLMTGFGFETITTAANRSLFMRGVLDLFGLGTLAGNTNTPPTPRSVAVNTVTTPATVGSTPPAPAGVNVTLAGTRIVTFTSFIAPTTFGAPVVAPTLAPATTTLGAATPATATNLPLLAIRPIVTTSFFVSAFTFGQPTLTGRSILSIGLL